MFLKQMWLKYAALVPLFLASVRAVADLQPGEISNVVVSNVTTTSVTVTWNTVHAGSSWVYYNWCGLGSMAAVVVGQNDSVTHHSVSLTGLVPYNPNAGLSDVGCYGYYVGSKRTDNGTWAAYGGPPTNAFSNLINFHTTTLNPAAPLNWDFRPLGQKHIYAGHDLYLAAATVLLAGDGGLGGVAGVTSAQVRRVSDNVVMPTIQIDVLGSLRSYPGGFNPGPGWDGDIAHFISGPNVGKEFFYRPASAQVPSPAACQGTNCGAVRIRVPSNIPAGDYQLSMTLQAYTSESGTVSIGNPVSFTWPFHVYAPATFTPTPPSSFPAIPTLSTWKSTMTANVRGGGEWWCTESGVVNPAASVEYGPFAGTVYSYVGSFNYNYFQGWNYDGGEVYQQIADYDYNTPGMPGYHNANANAHWKHCAQGILYPYDNWLTRSTGHGLTEPNQFLLGTATYYLRTHDATAASALAQTTDRNGNFNGMYGSVDTRGIRVSAYTWMSQIANEVSGLHGPWQLSGMATDVMLANLDMFQQYTGTNLQPEWNYHNFQLGLAFRTLIAQCELDKEKSRPCDPRIPIEIGKSLYYLYNNFYLADVATTRFDLVDVPMSHTWGDPNSTDVFAGLNQLIAPAAAWYWALTGDKAMRAFGDALFAGTWHDTGGNTWGHKEFNQIYMWSFDFVRYRSGPNAKPTFLPSQNPFEGAWPDTSPPLMMVESECRPGIGYYCQDGNLTQPSVNGQSGQLAWDTIENATSEIYYTTASVNACTMTQGAYRASVSKCLAQYTDHYSADPGGVRHHAPNLSNLRPDTKYHFRRVSCDLSGNCVMTPDATFTTDRERRRP